MKKRALSLLLVLAMLVMLLPTAALAETAPALQETTSGMYDSNLTWTLDESGLLTISGTGEMGNTENANIGASPWYDQRESIRTVIIGSGITTIGGEAFYGCTGLTGITIPSSVEKIGRGAFSGCSSLESIQLPTGVTSIGEAAFSGCSALKIFAIPTGVTSISQCMFTNCTSLQSIVIPSGVTSIGGSTFMNCSSLTGIVLPSGINTVEGYTFNGCTSLQSITIPKNVTDIGFWAFNGCTSLTDVSYSGSEEDQSAMTIDTTNTCLTGAQWHYNAEEEPEIIACGSCGDGVIWKLDADGLLTISGTGEIVCCTEIADHPGWYSSTPWESVKDSIKTAVIEEGVTSIGRAAFQFCTTLTGVTIPDSVTEIDYHAFAFCTGLESVTIPEKVTTIGEAAFDFCSSLKSVTIPGSAASIGDLAFNGCSGLKSLTICSGVKSIGASAFGRCSGLTRVQIPSSVTTISAGAFAGCSSLEALLYEEPAAGTPAFCSIDGVLFSGDKTELVCCPGGKSGSYEIPETVAVVRDSAFQMCSLLTCVTIPKSVTGIGSQAFDSCSGLTQLQVESGSTAFSSADGVLYNAEKTELICCPAGKTGTYEIPSGVTTIGDQAFKSCSSLTGITLPKSVTTIGGWAFALCSSLKELAIPSGVTAVGEAAFDGCSSLTSLVIPNGVTALGTYACISCSSLQSITIPKSLTTVGQEAFSGCTGLTDVYYGGSEDDRSAMTIDTTMDGNTCLTGAEWHYNWVTEEEKEIIASGTCGENLTWKLDADGLLTISGTGKMEDYSYNNSPWYAYASSISSVVVKSGVQNVSVMAFAMLTGLESVTLADSVATIGDSAFSGCSALNSLTLPDTVSSIGSNAFAMCLKLKNLNIPKDMTVIGSSAFASSGISSLTIPDTVTAIGEYAFTGCSNLSSVTIPDSVTTIGKSAFSGCMQLTGVKLPNGLTAIGESVFSHCGFSTITIPDSVTSIGKSAFNGCSSLQSLTIPENVVSIGDDAFNYCYALTDITIPASVTSLNGTAFRFCTALKEIRVNENSRSFCSVDGVLFNYDKTQLVCYPAGKTGTSYEIPSGVTAIGQCAFYNCDDLTAVTIPSGVTDIGGEAFAYCGSLKEITVPEGVTTLADRVFDCCSKLEAVTIPDTVTSIESMAFFHCDCLKSVTIPEKVTAIGASAFKYCTALTTVYYGGTKAQWDAVTIGSDNDALTSANIVYTGEPVSMTLTFDKDFYFAGETAKAIVHLSAENGNTISGLQFTVSNLSVLSAAGLTLQSITPLLSGVSDASSVSTGRAALTASGSGLAIDTAGVDVAALTFTVAATVPECTMTPVLSSVLAYSLDGAGHQCMVSAESVNLSGSASFSFISLPDYEDDQVRQEQIVLLSAAKKYSWAIGSVPLYWSSAYHAYAGIVSSAMTEADCRAQLTRSSAEPTAISYTGDIRVGEQEIDGRVNVADAVAVLAEVQQADVSYSVSDLMRLAMDVTGDQQITIADVQYILEIIVGRRETTANQFIIEKIEWMNDGTGSGYASANLRFLDGNEACNVSFSSVNGVQMTRSATDGSRTSAGVCDMYGYNTDYYHHIYTFTMNADGTHNLLVDSVSDTADYTAASGWTVPEGGLASISAADSSGQASTILLDDSTVFLVWNNYSYDMYSRATLPDFVSAELCVETAANGYASVVVIHGERTEAKTAFIDAVSTAASEYTIMLMNSDGTFTVNTVTDSSGLLTGGAEGIYSVYLTSGNAVTAKTLLNAGSTDTIYFADSQTLAVNSGSETAQCTVDGNTKFYLHSYRSGSCSFEAVSFSGFSEIYEAGMKYYMSVGTDGVLDYIILNN